MRHSFRCWGVLLISGILFLPKAQAKTLTLSDEDCDRMAQICESAPRSSWAGSEISTGVFYNASIDLAPHYAFLICYPLDEIPKNQKITKAELTFSVSIAPNEQKIQIRRIIGSWGAGVSWKYRHAGAKKVEWATPGAKSGGKDRVTKPTAIAKANGTCDINVNLTEDVELWYAGAAKNDGWIITVDAPDGFVRMPSPTWISTGTWKLRITYEPK